MEEIKKYIKQQLEAGVDKETIEKSLEKNGWTHEDIQNAFESFDALEKPKENAQAQASEKETVGQNETEIGEIKSFKSFLKLCWGKKISRYSITLGTAVIFLGFFSFYVLSILETSNLQGVSLFLFYTIRVNDIPIIIIGSFVIITGTWWGIREKRKINFLEFLLTIITLIFPYFLLFWFLFHFFWFLTGFLVVQIIGFLLLLILSLMTVYLYTKKDKIKKYLKRIKAGEIKNFGSVFAKTLLKLFIVMLVVSWSLILLRFFVFKNLFLLISLSLLISYFLLFPIFIIAALLFVVGLVKYVTCKFSEEINPQKQSEAKKIIFYTVIIICLAVLYV